MPFKKIDEDKTWETKRCMHPEHDMPGHIVLQPGRYEYECPGCGEKRYVNVPEITCTNGIMIQRKGE